MIIPTSALEFLFLAIALVPGLTYASVKRLCGGTREADYGAAARTLEAIYSSLVFIVIYGVAALALSEWRIGQLPSRLIAFLDSLPGPLASLLVVILGLVVPAVVAAFFYKGLIFQSSFPWVVRTARGLTSEPRAWEGAAGEASSPCFVRIQLPTGEFFGGWYGNSSRMGLYPYGRDLFLEVQWKMDKKGRFSHAVPNGRGLWLAVPDGAVVEWFDVSQNKEK